MAFVGFVDPNIVHKLETRSFFYFTFDFWRRKKISHYTPYRYVKDFKVHEEWFFFDIFNNIKCPGLLNHCLRLKVEVSIILLMNIDQASVLCNGTCFKVKELCEIIIATTIITRKERR
jgi:hypothetical protein